MFALTGYCILIETRSKNRWLWRPTNQDAISGLKESFWTVLIVPYGCCCLCLCLSQHRSDWRDNVHKDFLLQQRLRKYSCIPAFPEVVKGMDTGEHTPHLPISMQTAQDLVCEVWLHPQKRTLNALPASVALAITLVNTKPTVGTRFRVTWKNLAWGCFAYPILSVQNLTHEKGSGHDHKKNNQVRRFKKLLHLKCKRILLWTQSRIEGHNWQTCSSVVWDGRGGHGYGGVCACVHV